jgi:DNA topoisomerase-1
MSIIKIAKFLQKNSYITVRDQKKIHRIKILSESLDKLKSKVKEDIRSTDDLTKKTALIVSLIDHTYERVGNEDSAEAGHYGITGLKRKHVSFGNGKATLNYVGKSGVKQKKNITDSSIVKALKDAVSDKSPDEDIFTSNSKKITSKDVNGYLKPFKVTAKDIRGFYANKVMREQLQKLRKQNGELPTDSKEKKELKKDEFAKALKETAQIIGHEEATLKNHYLMPHFDEGIYK